MSAPSTDPFPAFPRTVWEARDPSPITFGQLATIRRARELDPANPALRAPLDYALLGEARRVLDAHAPGR